MGRSLDQGVDDVTASGYGLKKDGGVSWTFEEAVVMG